MSVMGIKVLNTLNILRRGSLLIYSILTELAQMMATSRQKKIKKKTLNLNPFSYRGRVQRRY